MARLGGLDLHLLHGEGVPDDVLRQALQIFALIRLHAAANAAINAHVDRMELDPIIRSNGSLTLADDRGRRDLTEFLEWEKPDVIEFGRVFVLRRH